MAEKSQALERLINELRGAHGDNLSSVTVYGSTARDGSDANSSHDVLVVLRGVELADLSAAIEPIRNWTRLGQPMPVYFSQDELQRAADVFPIEFLQMEQARKILYGSDPFEFVQISTANLRHQTEYELRTKCLQLRRLFFSAATSSEQLTRLMADSLSSFAALFRAVLMLNGAPPAVSKRESVQQTVDVLGLDGTPFEHIFELTDKGNRLKKSEAERLFADYLREIQRVIDAVDQMDRN
jgi:hypothetical protein